MAPGGIPLEQVIGIYAAILGIGLLAQGIAEFLAPDRIFRLWAKWVNHKLYFLHGLILIIGGFPLTAYRGRFSGIVFAIGLVIVFTGPFILMYPEKIRKIFGSIDADNDRSTVRRLMYADASIRILAGGLFVTTYIVNSLEMK